MTSSSKENKMEGLILKNGAIRLREIAGAYPTEDKTLAKVPKQEKESFSCQALKTQSL